MLKDSVKEYLSKELDCNFSLESPKDRSLAHFAMPCFSFAKELRKSPNQIAQDFANKLKIAIFLVVLKLLMLMLISNYQMNF